MKALPLLLLILCVPDRDVETPIAEFRDPSGKFKAMFPGKPKVQQVVGQNNVKVIVIAVESDSFGYVITYYDLPADLKLDADFHKQGLPTEVDGIFAGAKGKKESSKLFKLQDRFHGMEYTGTWTKPKDLNVRGRVIFAGSRIYNVIVAGSADKLKTEATTKFLDSFKIEP
jgi:hypothetical protein